MRIGAGGVVSTPHAAYRSAGRRAAALFGRLTTRRARRYLQQRRVQARIWNDLEANASACAGRRHACDRNRRTSRRASRNRLAIREAPSTDALDQPSVRRNTRLRRRRVQRSRRFAQCLSGIRHGICRGRQTRTGLGISCRRKRTLRDDVDAFFAKRSATARWQRLIDRYFCTRNRAAHRCRRFSGTHQDRCCRIIAPCFKRAGPRGIDWRLLAAIAYQESQWDASATSETGVRGLMQLTEDTARKLGVVDRLDPQAKYRGRSALLARAQGQAAAADRRT